MKAIQLVVDKGKAISMAEARRIILQGGLKVNGKIITVQEGENVNDLECNLVPGDKVQIGKSTFIEDV